MYNEVESLMLVFRLDGPILYARLSGNDNQASLSYIRGQWEGIFPGKPFEYEFLADTFRDQFSADRTRRTVFAGFTILTIFIACLGLFGLVSYTTERRTREISIRKVHGASVSRILQLIIREFLILVVIASLVASPVVWFLMRDWLQNYVYRTDMTPMVFLWTLLLLLVPTLITISYQSYRAAIANPAEALQVE
jgi:putative ABC transport system permease protein